LQAGEKQTLILKLAKSDLASFDNEQSAWVVDPGTYSILLGSSSRDIRQTAELIITDTDYQTNKQGVAAAVSDIGVAAMTD